MPFSIEIDPMSDELKEQATALARTVSLDDVLDRRIGDLDPAARLRVDVQLSEQVAAGMVGEDAIETGRALAHPQDVNQILRELITHRAHRGRASP